MTAPIAREHAGFIAWPTLLLAAGVVLGHLGTWVAVASGLPIWVGVLANTLLAYLAFTPLHEAVHGNVGGKRKRAWLDAVVGWPMGLLLGAPFVTFQLIHLRHHTHTNDPDKDPDFWVAGNGPIAVAVRCLTIIPHYYLSLFAWRNERSVRAIAFRTVAGVAGFALGAAVLAFAGFGASLLWLWLVPAWLASGLLAFLLDWLPHSPHDQRGHYVDTRVVLAPGLELLTMWQNLHVVHHLHPHVVFYRYGRVFDAIRPTLEREGTPIYELGRSSQGPERSLS